MRSSREPIVNQGLLRWIKVAIWSDSILSVVDLLLLLLVVAIVVIFLFDLLLYLILILNTMASLILTVLIRILHYLPFISGPLNQYLFNIALNL
jgi:hypothetical protein